MSNKKPKKRKKIIKFNQIAIVVALMSMLIILGTEAYNTTAPAKTDMTYNEFVKNVNNDNVDSVTIIKSQDTFNVSLKNGEKYSVINPNHDTFKLELLEKGVNIQTSKQTAPEAIRNILGTLPLLILAAFLIFYLSKTTVLGARTMFKVLKPEDTISFNDVAGMSESKKEVMFAVEQIKQSNKLASIGAIPTRGIILEGPPGTGKTMLAKAIAGEADVPFISTSGSDFIEMFVGLGAARVRALWELAETNAPCVLFIDEIDAVGRRRSGGGDGATTESNQTLNALLQKMDGLETNTGVFVVAATNRISDLDPALLRPGRFDKQLYIGPPKSKKDRDEIIRVHLKNKRLKDESLLDNVSKLMFGMSGAEIAQILNESVLISLSKGREGIIDIEDVDEASMKLRASGVVTKHTSDNEREIISVHEAGHAVISSLLGRKIAKVSIVPYSSGIGGITIQDTDEMEGRKLKTKSDILIDLKVLLSGKAAEEIILGQSSSGASNDIERASIIAYNLVNNLGMHDENLINIDIIGNTNNIIVDNKINIDRANKLLLDNFNEVKDMVRNNKTSILALRDKLLENETVLEYSTDV